MNVFISVDIEGATGVVSFSQCGRPDGSFYDFTFARRMLTGDVNAAIRGARAAGAKRIVVKDSHASCRNLLIDDLERGVELISGWGAGRLDMMDGIDASFDAALLVGYHVRAGSIGLMDHALIGGLHRLYINEEPAGEIAISAAIAGAFGVPTVLVTGDAQTCAEAEALMPGINTFSTKVAIGHAIGALKPADVTWPGITAAAKAALTGVAGFKPYVLAGTINMRMEFRTAEESELPATALGVIRKDAYNLEIQGKSFPEALRVALAVFKLSMQGRKSGT